MNMQKKNNIVICFSSRKRHTRCALVTGDQTCALPISGYEWLRELLTDEGRNSKVKALAGIAEELDCSLGQMAIAWCARNPRVYPVITGASSVEQEQAKRAAPDVLPKPTDDVMARITEAVAQSDQKATGKGKRDA